MMKRIFFILTFLVLTIWVKAQYPIPQNIGSPNTLVQVPANGGFRASLINRSFLDTSAANATAIDYYPGAQIYTTSDNNFWYRNSTATRWVKVGSESGGQSSTTIIGGDTLVICYQDGSCDTLDFSVNIINLTIIGDTVIACDTSYVFGIDTVYLQLTCDTIILPSKPPLVFQTGLTQTDNVVELGVGSGSPNNPNTGNPLNWLFSPRTINTTGNTLTHTGWPVWMPVTHTYQQQSFALSTDISTWRGAGGVLDTAIDFNNSVLLHLGQTGRTYSAGIDSGFYGHRIGYTLGTNLSGRSSFGVGVDNQNSKWSTILFNTLDTANTNAVLEIYGGRPPLQPLLNDPLQSPVDPLSSYRILSLNYDKSIQAVGYASTGALISSDTTNNKPAAFDANGNFVRMEYWPGAGGGFTTADNGLTANTATNVQLGGTLLQNTTITQSTFNLTFASSATTGTTTSSALVFTGNSLTSGTGMYLSSTSLSSGSLMNISVNSTAASSGSQKALNVTTSGANANASQTTYGIYSTNSHTGINASNYGIYSEITAGNTSSAAIYAQNTGTNGFGILVGAFNSTTAISATAASGTSISAFSTSGLATSLTVEPTSTNTVVANTQINRGTTGTAASGIGTSIDFNIETDGGNSRNSNQLISKWLTAADATRTSQFIITGVTSASTQDWLILGQSGYMQLRNMTVAEAGAITPANGMIIYVSDTDGTFSSVGFWGRENGVWVKL